VTAESPLVLGGEFPTPTRDEWMRGVDRVLAKGSKDLTREDLARRFDRSLVTALYDDISIQPLYTAADALDAEAGGVPGIAPFTRGSTLLVGSQEGWDVRQAVDISFDDPEATGRSVLSQLDGGASSIILRAKGRATGPAAGVDVDRLQSMLAGVYLDLITVSLDASLGSGAADALLDLWDRSGVSPEAVRGVLGIDPIGERASSGDSEVVADLQAMAATALRCVATYPGARSVVVDVTRYHEAGCSDSEELGCAMATGVAYLRELTKAGLSVDQALSQIEFRFAATSDQFLTIAKLRAARRLWSRVAEACGSTAPPAQHQHAMASRAMLSRYDPWVNLLRGTIACFAAGVGGADAVTVEPYDLMVEPGKVSELGLRMARNTQVILIEESHAAKVIDPAGGSWYVESLTQSVAERSWAFLQEIEAAGGMLTAVEDGLVARTIDRTWELRLDNLSRRKDTVTGVSDFPNAAETIPAPLAEAQPLPSGLPRRRYAAPFEELRERVDAFDRRASSRPTVLLVNLGTASDYTARSTYAKSFFETAGLSTDSLEVGGDFESALTARVAGGLRVACLCSSDARYVEAGEAVAKLLAHSGLDRVYLAGRHSPELASLSEAGVDEFIGVGCDVLASLQGVLVTLGVG
jgi:methylmalonyl-CoA mutase